MTKPELEKLDAHLRWLNSEGSNGKRAEFKGYDFHGVNLDGRDLRGVDLSGAKLNSASLQNSDLTEATLQGANLRNANLRDVILRDADLSGVAGLLPVQLAGSDLRGAVLPDEFKEFKGLKQVEDGAEYCRKLLIAMLGACVYSWLTIGSTSDARLIPNTGTLSLPFVGAAVPLVGFYVAAPLILFAVYLYFHLNLLRLWEYLASLPAVLPDGRTLDKAADPWLLVGLVRSHLIRLRLDRPPLSRVQSALAVLMAWWAIPLTFVGFWLRYLSRQDWWGTLLHVAFLVSSLFLGAYFQLMARRTLRGKEWTFSERKFVSIVESIGFLVIFGSLFFLLSAGIIGVGKQSPFPVRFLGRTFHLQVPPTPGMTVSLRQSVWGLSDPTKKAVSDHPLDPQSWVPRLLKCCGNFPYANLSLADISSRPANWTGHEKLAPSITGPRLEGRSLRFAYGLQVFLVNAKLEDADLTGADLDWAELIGADLRRTDLTQASLWHAKLPSARLDDSHLNDTDLRETDLRDAKFDFAILDGADFNGADLEGATFLLTDLTGTNFHDSNITADQLGNPEHGDEAILPSSLVGTQAFPLNHNVMAVAKLEEEIKAHKIQKPIWWNNAGLYRTENQPFELPPTQTTPNSTSPAKPKK